MSVNTDLRRDLNILLHKCTQMFKTSGYSLIFPTGTSLQISLNEFPGSEIAHQTIQYVLK